MKMYKFVKLIIIVGAISFLLLALFIPFVGYDNGVRCITEPCESSTNGTLLQFLGFGLDNWVVDIDYYVPIFWFLLFFAIVWLVVWRVEKDR